jgi:hypothetical protein
MLQTIRRARRTALAKPRVDMPGAPVQPGRCRHILEPLVPSEPIALQTRLVDDGLVELSWERSARTIGLEAEVHRSDKADFTPSDDTLLTRTRLFRYVDEKAPTGKQHYALVLRSAEQSTAPNRASIDVPPPKIPPTPQNLVALPASCSVRLQWDAVSDDPLMAYEVYRAGAGSDDFRPVTPEPVRTTELADSSVEVGKEYAYTVRAVSRRGARSESSAPLRATPTIIQEPVFSLSAEGRPEAEVLGGEPVPGKLSGDARFENGVLTLAKRGWLAFDRRGEFDLFQPFSVELWVKFDEPGQMPVVVGAGEWNNAGWFLQRIGGRWRWHVGGVSCDGGRPAIGPWLHVAAIWDGEKLRLFQDGELVAENAGPINTAAWPGPMVVGQYAASLRPDYQTHGTITGLKIYHRPLAEQEIAESAGEPPR